jgi:uncharacterized RDD family membrane protein YckC
MAEIVTGEAVALELPAARFPSRVAARLIDTVVQLVVLLAATAAVAALTGSAGVDYVTAAGLSVSVLVIVGYPTVVETLTRGRTLGKLVFGLRVVGDDGGPIRFRQALVRALTAVIEVWTLPPIALICSIASDRGKRVGDFFAGTYVVQERTPVRQALPAYLAVVPPQLAGWAQSLQVTALSEQTAEAAGSYLRRYAELSPGARDALGFQLASTVAAQVSPPPPAGTPPVAFLAAVLAVRRQRELTTFGGWVPTASAGQAPQTPAASFPPGATTLPQPPTQHPPPVFVPSAFPPPGYPPAAADQPPGYARPASPPPATDEPPAGPSPAPPSAAPAADFVPPA